MASASTMQIHEMLLHPFICDSQSSGKMKQFRAKPSTLRTDTPRSHHRIVQNFNTKLVFDKYWRPYLERLEREFCKDA